MKYLLSFILLCSFLAAAPVGIFTDVSGTVQMKQGKSEEWSQIKQGDPFSNDCMVVAADGGRAELMFFDGNTKFTLLPKSAAKVKANPNDFAGDKKIQLKLGVIIGEARGGKDGMLKVYTSTSQVNAGKAKFIVSAGKEGATRVNSIKGRVVVINRKLGAEASIWDGKEIVSDAKDIVEGLADPQRIAKLIKAGGSGAGVKGNKKIVLTFKGEGKKSKEMSILLKEREN